MKTSLIMAAVAAASLAFCSCDEATRLADKVQGTWHGETVTLGYGTFDSNINNAYVSQSAVENMAWTPTLSFTRDDGSKGGSLNIQAEYTLTQGVSMAYDSLYSSPVKATVNGFLSADGKWLATDDDEITVTIDPSKISLKVDTASLSLDYSVLTDRPRTTLDALKSKVAANIEGVVRSAIVSQISTIREFDDITFDNGTMTLEAGPTVIRFVK